MNLIEAANQYLYEDESSSYMTIDDVADGKIFADLWDTYALDSGDCGSFAIALNTMMGKKCSYVAVVNDAEPENFYHVALKCGKYYIDANGVVSKTALLDHGYEDGVRSKPYIIPADEWAILRSTTSDHSPEEILEDLKNIQERR
jgi:hypothetical protein